MKGERRGKHENHNLWREQEHLVPSRLEVSDLNNPEEGPGPANYGICSRLFAHVFAFLRTSVVERRFPARNAKASQQSPDINAFLESSQ